MGREIHGLTFDTTYGFGVEVEPLVIAEEQLRELRATAHRIILVAVGEAGARHSHRPPT